VLHQILRRLREIESDWRERASMPQGRAEHLRLAAYRLKRQLVRSITTLQNKSQIFAGLSIAAVRPKKRTTTTGIRVSVNGDGIPDTLMRGRWMNL
jgi:hypothetical protein